MSEAQGEILLVINPGSTSTKVAIFDGPAERRRESIEHSAKELAGYPRLNDQLPMRSEAVRGFLLRCGLASGGLTAIVARGGVLPPVHSGAYLVDEALVGILRDRPHHPHASNLAAMIAFEIAREVACDLARPEGLPAYIYDSVSVDELEEVARLSGARGLPRESFSHVLNARAMCIRYAASRGEPYGELNLIAAHLGGGISVGAHRRGRLVDVVTGEDGPFSPERAGGLPTMGLIELCRKDGFDQALALQRGSGGLVSYLGTNSAIEVERRIDAGDAEAELVLKAMAYQVAKAIGEMATALKGAADAIVITGGMAHSARLTGWIAERVDFIAPVAILPGENEMQALADGALRVLRGEEKARRIGED